MANPERNRRNVLKGILSGISASVVGGTATGLSIAPAIAQSVGNWNQGGRTGGDYASTKTEIFKDFSVSPMINRNSLRNIQNAIAKYEIIVSRGGWPHMPNSRILVHGSKQKIVRILKQRLVSEGYLPANYPKLNSKKFDRPTQVALVNFQKAMGLHALGRLDKATRKALNVTASTRLTTLRSNLPRVKEAVHKLSDRYIIVNIPATQLDAVEFGVLYSRHNVIAGQSSRPSPMLQSRVSELNFNPYWNAPVSIVRRDILPKMQKNLNILKTLDIKIFDGYGGPEVDPKTVDWSKADAKRYHFRQQPGEGNAMASVKINFANKYAVYMHDTPTKQLFGSGQRYFSSGCVRIDKVHVLTEWLLKNQGDWNQDKIQSVVKSGDRLDVKVRKSTQVRFVYLTSWVTDDGIAHFRSDIYKLDGTGFVSGQPRALPL